MHCIAKKYLIVSLCVAVSCKLSAQSDSVAFLSGTNINYSDSGVVHKLAALKNMYTIGGIVITGNRKTKPYLIKRELPFQTGDSLSLTDLVNQFDLARRQIMNLRLFNEVVVSFMRFRGSLVDVAIDVKERWYLFPMPFFRSIDRNLSEWAKQGYGLDRVNYGARLSHYNLTGRNDKLKALFITGYTPQIQFSYDQPNADKNLRHGYGVNVSYTTAKEVNYLTQNNEQRFVPLASPLNSFDTSLYHLFHKQVLNEQFNILLSYTYRPAIHTRHTVRLSYNISKIDKAVLYANPRYFSNGKFSVSYPELSYSIEYSNVDYGAYPLTGFWGDASFTKRGINADMNLWHLNARGAAGWKVADKLFFGLQVYGAIKLPFDQPYINQRLFGYGDVYLRGLEKYVIDGVAGGQMRTTLRKETFHFTIPLLSRFRSLDKIPLRIYLKTYADGGYAYSRTINYNPLTNKLLYTAGAGFDVVTFYDFVFRFEYSMNQLGQKGLFLHFRNDF